MHNVMKWKIYCVNFCGQKGECITWNETNSTGEQSVGSVAQKVQAGKTSLLWKSASLPGYGHDFHKHPDQEEVIYVIEGSVEQWLEDKKQTLNAGDSVFIPADMVHASFNVSSQSAKLFVTLSPSKGAEGYQLIDVYDQAPWNTLRS